MDSNTDKVVAIYKALCKDTVKDCLTSGKDESNFHIVFGKYFVESKPNRKPSKKRKPPNKRAK